MSPLRNRWTGEPHRHERERERRQRQARNALLKQLALAEMARVSASPWFSEFDRELYAMRFAQLKETLASPKA